MRWMLYEDDAAEQLAPLTLTRPVFELICGRDCLRRRVQRWYPASRWGVLIRDWLTETYREEQPQATVNDCDTLADEDVLVINGRWVPDGRPDANSLTRETVGYVGDQLAWIVLSGEELRLLAPSDVGTILQGLARNRHGQPAGGVLVERPWDIVNRNGPQLELDFADEGLSQSTDAAHVQCLGSESDVYIAPTAVIDPYVVIDARHGPVSIDRDVHVQSFTRIEGPCHIARNSRLFRANIQHGTTIGHDCRVGGEVEESILHAWVNKYHEGFLGHSYVCPWVNLGAISTTSDLKSDYSTVQVPLQGTPIDSETIKVGSFIGDHSKTAIDSMFNTGSSIGVMTLILPGGRLLPRHIPSFCNVSFGQLAEDWSIDQYIATARAAMSRRDCQLTEAQESLFRDLYRRTSAERTQAITRMQHRQGQQATAPRL